MKRMICILLAAGPVAMAGEAKAPADAPAARAPEAESSPREITIPPDRSGLVRMPPATCYFIRNLGLLPEGVEPLTGFIPLQTPQSEGSESAPQSAEPDPETFVERMLESLRERNQTPARWQFRRGPDCTGNATLMPLRAVPEEPAGEPPEEKPPPAGP